MPVPAALKGGFAPPGPRASQRAIHLGAPFGRTPAAQQGGPTCTPLNSKKCYGELSKTTCLKQLCFMQISESVSLVVHLQFSDSESTNRTRADFWF